ncbi:MAG: hypothetical protein SF182_08300, partial [Deltaproteobacteria bacterium]|nr:hypothetical protein [Deltaproteobacteria bacterium]
MRRGGSLAYTGALGIAAALLMLTASTASAQFSSVTVTNSSDADATNDGITNGNQRLSSATVSNTATTISGRYRWVVAADSGIFTNASISLNSDYRVNFTVNVGGAYSLTVNTNWNGGHTIVDDGSGTSTADTGALTGSYMGGSLASGTLSLGDPGNRSSGSTGVNAFTTSSASATIDGVSNGSPVAHQVRFQWSSSCNSPGGSQFLGADECAVRAGLAATISGQTAGAYPGQGGRDINADGHFVNISITKYCGNGVVDGARGEQCDTAISGTTCCTANCVWASAGTSCRAAAGDCDVAETCPGNGPCPADSFEPATTVCRAASPGETCDEVETCTGSSATCPADAVKVNGTLCR